MAEKVVSFADVDVEKKRKDEYEEPTISVISAANTPSTSGFNTPRMPSTPKDEPEAYELPIIPPGNFTTALPSAAADTKKERRVEMMSLCALFWAIFLEGWNDGTNGPMLPAIQKHYSVCISFSCFIFPRSI